MQTAKLTDLRDWADQLTALGATFQWSPGDLRAPHIRKAEKHLILLESQFPEDAMRAREVWINTYQALIGLQRRREKFQKKQDEISEIDAEIKRIKQKINAWLSLEEQNKLKMQNLIKSTEDYLRNKTFISESHILHQYKRYQILHNLIPYCDNADYLCDSISHFKNRDAFEKNRENLKKRIHVHQKKIETIQRGIWLAAIMCCFIITIPLCAPFVFTLWNRKKEIEKDLSSTLESMRREERRLHLADESIIAVQEIRSCLGDQIGVEELRRTLSELRELHTQFKSKGSKSKTILLMKNIEENHLGIGKIFGTAPDDFLSQVKWIHNQAADLVPLEKQLNNLFMNHENTKQQIKDLMRGHSVGELDMSIAVLREHVVKNTVLAGVDLKTQFRFASLSKSIGVLLQRTRHTLGLTTHSQAIPHSLWTGLLNQTHSKANELSLLYLENALDSGLGNLFCQNQNQEPSSQQMNPVGHFVTATEPLPL